MLPLPYINLGIRKAFYLLWDNFQSEYFVTVTEKKKYLNVSSIYVSDNK
jgi:hypothetical protein